MKTPGFYPGCTRQPGKRHLHTDGLKNPVDMAAVLDFAVNLGFPSETLTVVGCTENPARTDVVSAEGHHEINHPGDLISTTLVEPFSATTVSQLIRFILGFPGVTIELEHVVGHVSEEWSEWEDPAQVQMARFDLAGANYTSPEFLPIEYHHAIDFSATAAALPNLEDLLTDTLIGGIMVGTWYVFSRPGQLAFRSNVFADVPDIRERVEREHETFRQLCERCGWIQYPIRTVAERVLGIWTSSSD